VVGDEGEELPKLSCCKLHNRDNAKLCQPGPCKQSQPWGAARDGRVFLMHASAGASLLSGKLTLIIGN
jgi:hypothetical protein